VATWLVTGCSSGIGRATALAAARAGERVWATMRDPGRGEQLLADAVGCDLRVIALDVTDPEGIAATMRVIGEVDVLVNNAGIAWIGALEEQPVDDVKAVFDTNVFGPLRMAQAVLPGMRARGHGVIVNVTSVVGERAGPVMGAYGASKHALEGLSEALAEEVRRFGVRVVIVQPGLVRSEVAHSGVAGATRPDAADSPYARMHEAVAAGWSHLVDVGDPPEVVAAEILRAVTAEGTDAARLRWPTATMYGEHAGDWLVAQRQQRSRDWLRARGSFTGDGAAMDAPGRIDPPLVADERTALSAWLDFHRATIEAKVAGITDAQARRTPLASDTSLVGIVRHLAAVERTWFQRVLLGRDTAPLFAADDDRDADFHPGPHDTLAAALATYRAECDESRRIVADAASLDVRSAVEPFGDGAVDLRWILVHMIEETARHAGHADAVRELVDGSVGD
jgi:NAD(P)-dependent dehydrogenase (short-subunit alcohol dehydrogenase family)